MTKPLSPAALAVRDAAFCAYDDENLYVATGERHAGMVAAALRAAADQVVPEEQRLPRRGVRPGGTDALTPEEGAEDQRAATRRRFLAIAVELEGRND